MSGGEELEGPVTRSWTRILCAVDFSESARYAVELAAQMAQRLGAELTLLHVREVPQTSMEAAPDAAWDEGDQELRLGMARTKLFAQQYTDRAVETRIVIGAAAEEIVAFAWQGRFDLVVTGTHGRTGMKRMVLGSVAEKVVRRAPCPVLVARPASVAPAYDDAEPGAAGQ